MIGVRLGLIGFHLSPIGIHYGPHLSPIGFHMGPHFLKLFLHLLPKVLDLPCQKPAVAHKTNH